MRLILLSAAALLIGAVPGDRDKVPEATPVGEAISCISMQNIRETRVRSDRIIDFIASGGKVYRNELPYACPGLNSERRFLHKTSTGQYCSVDTITVLHSPPMMQGATCGLGKFQPVALVKAH